MLKTIFIPYFLAKKIIILFALISITSFASATIINIPTDYTTIQAGINAASNYDTILVETGTYVENINFNGKNITLGSLFLKTRETSYISQTIIDGNQEGSVVTFENGEDSTAVLCGITIKNGQGGGSYPDYTGGGITCNNNSSPSLSNVAITNNSTDHYGGGIYCGFNSNPSLVNVGITGNSATGPEYYYRHGGGIYCNYNSSPNLENVTISNNTANDIGGGIYCEDSNPSLVDVTISNNTANDIGGGILFADSNPSLVDVTISYNTANDIGGGIYCSSSNPSLENVTVSNNTANDIGGGIYCSSSNPSLENVTVSNNTANDIGGGIYCRHNSNPSLVNCILWNDSPQEVYFDSSNEPNSIIISYSDIEGGETGIVTNNNGTVNWQEGNIVSNPLFVDPANGDFHLTENSPCIDAGDPDSPLDPDGSIADMGAFFYFQEISAQFVADTTYGLAPLHINYIDLTGSQDSIISWQWDFQNDGIIDSYEQNPSYTYTDSGHYSVKLIASTSTHADTMIKNDYIYAYTPTIINVPAQYSSIQTAVDFANEGDTVLVDTGTYVENINYNGKNITVASKFLTTQDTSYISQTIIDGNDSGSVITFESGEDSTSLLSGFTIINGNSDNGGGVNCVTSSPTLKNLIITDNTASNRGGGFSCKSGSNPSLVNVIISNNMTTGYYSLGGGIYCSSSNPTLSNVIIANNVATGDLSFGGGIYCYSANPIIQNTTIYHNTAANKGGGIYCKGGSNPSLVNSILWNNLTEEVYFASIQNPNSITISYSDIEGGETGIITNNNGIVYWEEGNINTVPLFADTTNEDYHLLENSPCIDAGSPYSSMISIFLPSDLDGNIRIWDGDGDGTAIIDMGPYEYDAPIYAIDDKPQTIINETFINYPNPINSRTSNINIMFSLKRSARINIKLYNIKGQLVDEIYDEYKTSGTYTISSNINNLVSGIYFIKMDVDGKNRSVKKMVKIK